MLICSESDLSGELRSTLIGRGGVDRFTARTLAEVRVLASALLPGAILVDRDLPGAKELVEALREEKVTRHRSVAILARGDLQPAEVEMLDAGANGILRLPPGPDWDERLSRLLDVPTRGEARIPVGFEVVADGGEEAGAGEAVNLSAGGMLLASQKPLGLHQELGFGFLLPDGTRVTGRGRVVREAGPKQYGVEFVSLDGESGAAIRAFVRSARLG